MAKTKKYNMKKEETISFWVSVSPWVIGFSAFTLGPMLFSFYYSMTDWDLFNAPVYVGFKNYIDAFNDDIFILAISNTLRYAFIAVPLSMILSIFMAYMLTLPIKKITIFRTIFYLPALVPIVASTMIFELLLAPNGYINSFLSFFGIQGPAWLLNTEYVIYSFVFIAIWGVGSTMVLMLSAIKGISQDLYEAAMIDGAKRFTIFIKIVLPMISPVIFFNLIMGVIGSLQTFSQVYIMTGGGPGNSSMMIVPYLYRQAFDYFDMGYASALAWILFVIVLLFTAVVFKFSNFWVFYETEVKKNVKQVKQG